MLSYNSSDFVDIPIFIKQLRKNKNLSQERLGRKVGVTGKTISAYETGNICPSIDVFSFNALLNILGVVGGGI